MSQLVSEVGFEPISILFIEYYCGDQVRGDEAHRTSVAHGRKGMRPKCFNQMGRYSLGDLWEGKKDIM
jgi:hypothetical protein